MLQRLGFEKSKLQQLGFDKLPGSTLKSAKTPEALINSKELFKEHFRAEVRAVTDGMNSNNVASFTKLAEARLNEILDKTFGQMEDRLISGKSIKDPIAHMKEANKLANKFLEELKPTAMQVASNDIRRNVMANRDDTVIKPQIYRDSNGNYNLVRSAPQIENLVLKGGGAKGIGYAPALREMAKTGMLDGLKQVVGTSAGALTAVSIAVGQSADELKELANRDLKTLMATDKSLRSVYPEVKFDAMLARGEANPMIKLLDEIPSGKVKDGLNEIHRKDDRALYDFAHAYAGKEGVEKSPAEILDRLAVLMDEPNFRVDRSGKMVTFSDMKMLHALAPKQFKEIQLTGYDVSAHRGVIFNAETHPDLPIAFAARISMAHPLIATGVVLDQKFDPSGHKYADGGISSNMPAEAVYGGDKNLAIVKSDQSVELQEIRQKTLLMTFDNFGNGYTALHGDTESRNAGGNYFLNGISKQIAQNPNLAEDNLMDKAKEHEAGPNTLIVFHGKIDTTDLGASQETKDFAEAVSTLKTLEHINNRSNASMSLTVNTVSSAMNLLTDQEKQLIYADGPPKLENFGGAMAPESFMAAKELYDMVKKAVDNPVWSGLIESA
jgi:predicted acylesterase/phospholipase RssA